MATAAPFPIAPGRKLGSTGSLAVSGATPRALDGVA
jgi:hypothetical protein